VRRWLRYSTSPDKEYILFYKEERMPKKIEKLKLESFAEMQRLVSDLAIQFAEIMDNVADEAYDRGYEDCEGDEIEP
jgi:hypothetical protein